MQRFWGDHERRITRRGVQEEFMDGTMRKKR